MAILSNFTIFCLYSYFDIHFLKLKLILFYTSVIYYFTNFASVLFLSLSLSIYIYIYMYKNW